jgi:hypothetical protein
MRLAEYPLASRWSPARTWTINNMLKKTNEDTNLDEATQARAENIIDLFSRFPPGPQPYNPQNYALAMELDKIEENNPDRAPEGQTATAISRRSVRGGGRLPARGAGEAGLCEPRAAAARSLWAGRRAAAVVAAEGKPVGDESSRNARRRSARGRWLGRQGEARARA